MPYAFGARFEQEKECLPGTRESFLRDICNVLNDPEEDASRVCLLTGVAGSGKSAVAQTIARLYNEQERLGSSYCFASSDIAMRNPQNLFSTIARNLADHDPQYKSALWSVVKGNRALRTSQSPSQQVESFIIEPSKHLNSIGPLLVVIDGLDESGDPASRRNILQAISKQIARNTFPTHLRFLITTRPEIDILDELPPCPQIIHKRMSDIPPDMVDRDIETFLRRFFSDYPRRLAKLERHWPNREWCRLLVHHSQGLFQWASTACNFIRGDGAGGLSLRERFELVTDDDGKGLYPLDKLYRTILAQQFKLDKAICNFRAVMAVVFALNEPLSITSLSTLFGNDLSVRDVINPLGSLLDGALDEEKPIRPLHTSFRDFLLDEARSSTFHISIQPQHSLCLGRTLLACMRKMLRFNIIDLKDPRVRNNAIPDLPTRVNDAVPAHLAYSCQHWMHHLQYSDCAEDLLNEVTCFFKDFLPYWLEVISLLSLSSPLPSIQSALETCEILKEWAKVRITMVISGKY